VFSSKGFVNVSHCLLSSSWKIKCSNKKAKKESKNKTKMKMVVIVLDLFF
jgi:hypothetical protein